MTETKQKNDAEAYQGRALWAHPWGVDHRYMTLPPELHIR